MRECVRGSDVVVNVLWSRDWGDCFQFNLGCVEIRMITLRHGDRLGLPVASSQQEACVDV